MFMIFSLREFSGFEVHVDPISIKFAETDELKVFYLGVAMLKMAVPIVDNLVNQLVYFHKYYYFVFLKVCCICQILMTSDFKSPFP